jgi:hypothetical protein
MKAIPRVLQALILTLALVATTGTSMAATTIIAMLKVGPTPQSWDQAYDNTPQNTLNISTTTGIYMSGKISNGGEYFTPSSMTIDITDTFGALVLHESYSSYGVGTRWNMIGSFGPNAYLSGSMADQGEILVSLALLDSNTPYVLSVEPGGFKTVTMTWNILGQQESIKASATLTNIPEPGTAGFIALTGLSFLLLRRRSH